MEFCGSFLFLLVLICPFNPEIYDIQVRDKTDSTQALNA